MVNFTVFKRIICKFEIGYAYRVIRWVFRVVEKAWENRQLLCDRVSPIKCEKRIGHRSLAVMYTVVERSHNGSMSRDLYRRSYIIVTIVPTDLESFRWIRESCFREPSFNLPSPQICLPPSVTLEIATRNLLKLSRESNAISWLLAWLSFSFDSFIFIFLFLYFLFFLFLFLFCYILLLCFYRCIFFFFFLLIWRQDIV